MKSSASHLYTLTGNLLWERTLEFEAWAPGRAQRAVRESFQVGGKGVNVSKMLNRLKSPNTALVFAGGFTGEACLAWMGEQGFATRAFAAEKPTRIGVVVRTGAEPDTTFFSPDSSPGSGAIQACADFLDAQPAGGTLVLCGSLPGWAEAESEPLRVSLVRWLGRGSLWADTYGPPLSWLVQRPLGLVKINRTEFDGLMGGSASPGGDMAVLLGEARRRWPVQAWIVTDGPGPVWLADGASPPVRFTPGKVREVSATGSGDVFLACVLHARQVLGYGWAQAVDYALPYAAANAAHPGIAAFPDPG